MASPFLTAIEPVFVSLSLGTCQFHARPSAKTPVLLGERDMPELGVIAVTIHHGGRQRSLGKAAWLNCRRQRSSERHELTHHNSSW